MAAPRLTRGPVGDSAPETPGLDDPIDEGSEDEVEADDQEIPTVDVEEDREENSLRASAPGTTSTRPRKTCFHGIMKEEMDGIIEKREQ